MSVEILDVYSAVKLRDAIKSIIHDGVVYDFTDDPDSLEFIFDLYYEVESAVNRFLNSYEVIKGEPLYDFVLFRDILVKKLDVLDKMLSKEVLKKNIIGVQALSVKLAEYEEKLKKISDVIYKAFISNDIEIKTPGIGKD